MITPEEARRKAAKHFERWYRRWAGIIFCKEARLVVEPGWRGDDGRSGVAQSGSVPGNVARGDDATTLSILLHPPTEKAVLAKGVDARAWVDSWRQSPLATLVAWEERNWSSVGRQRVPTRLVLPDASAIVQCAAKTGLWKRVVARTLALAERWRARWHAASGASPINKRCEAPAFASLFASAVQKCVEKYTALPEADWKKLLATLDWLMDNPEVRCFVRQLPVRGIDSKWLESHKAAVEPLYAAMTNTSGFAFATTPHHIRTRFLDGLLAPGGLRELSASPDELRRLASRPKRVIMVENLVSLYCLPELPGTIAFHGGGYGVDAFSQIEWLSTVPIYYWGDLDSNGFAILDRLRHHYPHVVSLMMDGHTLKLFGDLCGEEPSPKRGVFTCLTPSEEETVRTLLSGDKALRLEQERIAWDYALTHIQHAIKGCHS